jgi:hypothetical protein
MPLDSSEHIWIAKRSCHAERSDEANAVSLIAKSKHPYPQQTSSVDTDMSTGSGNVGPFQD